MTNAWRSRLIMVAPLFAFGFLALYTPSDDGPTVCPFALTTGMACPGCGLTRAAGYLVRGDIASALTYHPLVILIGIQAVAGWVWFALRQQGTVKPISNRISTAIAVGTAVSLIAVWLLRLGLGTLPPV